MSIEVILPVRPTVVQPVQLAPRQAPKAGTVLGLIDNGKPHANELMEAMARALERRGVVAEHFIWRKPTAGRPITPEERERMLTRAHMVITGVGD
jgi:nucleotide-binding universal stress UspA family protein